MARVPVQSLVLFSRRVLICKKAEVVEKTQLTGVCFCFLNGNKVAGTTLMMSPTVRNGSYFLFTLPQSVDGYYQSGLLMLQFPFLQLPGLHLPVHAAATHHFRNLMNCTNLRLTSNPTFFPPAILEKSHALARLAHGNWCAHMHQHTL